MRRFAILVGVLAVAGAVVQAQGGGQPQPAPKNLKVLPKDMPRQEVVQIMRGFTRGLGVRCQHCHVGEGNDLSKFDFASDTKPAKATARRMLTMVMAVNQTLGVEAGAPASERKVTCFTCHRGAVKPLTAAAAGGGG